MEVFILALASAFFIGLNQVLVRKGLDSISRGQAILASLTVATSIILAVNIFSGNLPKFFVPAAGLFFLVGLLGPGIGRTLNITSAKRIGVSRTVPIVGTAPFFASILAILFLGEAYTIYLFMGMALIVFGIFLLTRRKENGRHVFHKKDLFIPLAAALFGGASIVMTKVALNELPDPIVGVGLTLSAALFVVLGYVVATRQFYHLRIIRKGSLFPLLAGCSTAAAFLLNFTALEMGDVAVIAPVFSTFPLFGVFLSHFILKERITGRMKLGAVIIVSGVALIQAF